MIPKSPSFPENLLRLSRWGLLIVCIALSVGSVVALFLASLDWVTRLRFHWPWLLAGLPLAGVGIVWLYQKTGRKAAAGNNLLLDEIHEPGKGVPLLMAPLILVTTLVTHLFGGSAGREGTAVQIGGSIAAWFGRRFRLEADAGRTALMCGVAAGFGAVFGTPLAGAVFALEVVYIGRMHYKALLPCLLSAFAADLVCAAWGIRHTRYDIAHSDVVMAFQLLPALKIMVAGVLFGMAASLFSGFTDVVRDLASRFVRVPLLIPVAGGLVIIALSLLPGNSDYLGLGVSNPSPGAVSIVRCFEAGGAHRWSWLWKLVFTGITLATGFKGGEVTPLFFIGAALGNVLAPLAGLPPDLMAGLGFVAVFAGATNTPVACVLMGTELFGYHYLPYFAIACMTAYYGSGHTGIYAAQRVYIDKRGRRAEGALKTIKHYQEERRKRWEERWRNL